MKNLQPILAETLNKIHKLYKQRNMCIKKEKKQHMWDKEWKTYIIIIYRKEAHCM